MLTPILKRVALRPNQSFSFLSHGVVISSFFDTAKAFLSHRQTDFQNLGDVSCRSCCESASFSRSAGRASVAATIATEGNLLLLLCSEL